MYDGSLSLIMMFVLFGMYIPIVIVNNKIIILFVKPRIAGICLRLEAHKIQHLLNINI